MLRHSYNTRNYLTLNNFSLNIRFHNGSSKRMQIKRINEIDLT